MEFAESALGKVYHDGMKQGIQQGMQQGIQQGLIQGFKEMTFDLIEIKFGQTPDARNVQQLIKNIDDIDKLKTLKEKIKAGASISDLTAFLQQS